MENENQHRRTAPKKAGSPSSSARHMTADGHTKHSARIQARNKRITLIAVCVCVCLVLIGGISTGLYFLFRPVKDDGLILDNVHVGGINIGGMSREDAESALRLAIGDQFSTKSMVVKLPGASLTLAPEDTKADLDLESILEDAYRYGRSGTKLDNNLVRARAKKTVHTIALLPYLNLDLDYIRKAVDDFSAGYSTQITQPSVEIIGERPHYTPPRSTSPDVSENRVSLELAGVRTEVDHQKLIITMGTPQFILENNHLYAEILDAYSLFHLELYYEAPNQVEPDPVDLQAIFDKYCVTPKDASIDNVTFDVTPEVYGYGFDMEEAQYLLSRAKYGQRVEIPMDFLMPDITAQDLTGNLFKDTLASYTSNGDGTSDSNRNKNLQLSCAAINGLVLKVGESFNFNKVLGPLTPERGYMNAPNYSGSTVKSIGGGISQTASALHYCALLSGLNINERHSHRYAVPYTPMGTDAAISYGSENLIFTNNTSAPIRILASAKNGQVTITLQGTDDKDYQLKVEYDIVKILEPTTIYQSMTADNVLGYKDGQVIQESIIGYEICTYLCRYDLQTGDMLNRTAIGTSIYEKRDQIVVRIEGNSTEAPDPETPPQTHD